MSIPAQSRQLRSMVTSDGILELSLTEVDVPECGPNDVLVRIEASPINPSDLGLLFGLADMSKAESSGTAEAPVITAPVGKAALAMQKARLGQSMAVGNEGAGVVVAAGSAPEAQALMGKTVGVVGGDMYTQYRLMPAMMCMALETGTTPRQGASCFVNPLTALGMVETMRMENHTALVHTAAASNLGQMLNRICIADGVQLVNIVRKPEQEKILQDIGAQYICNSSSDTFRADLVKALTDTGATLAFDAIGGGELAGQILGAMEAAASANAAEYSRYGSDTYKQVYIYGGLDISPTVLKRNFGLTWGLGGWLLTPFLQKIGIEKMLEMQARVAAEINSTFASHYSAEVSLEQVLTLDAIAEYGTQSTGHKYLINPSL
ncbi:NADH oxidase [Halieaceae bacterium IMCC14734]|uniref:NADH oxidase n=1 Tax=Candidatus Litorirhabdus singularis TaxID=2518993 RepID=A0ABT3TG79_9GAMM|nr:zinc-binding dehydrogenase [Candidatus Litorirhabdus singularis]MCX2980417.1 NADH oxidase [Candidatus Litorirhabdus singularis]